MKVALSICEPRFIVLKEGNAEFAGVDNAGVDISARCGKAENCRSGQCGTMVQEWTLQEWTNQHDVTKVVIAGVDNAAP